ncbi:hypothetical protein CTEN210_11992 [Chaetoceros tenuissimus]|uniref:Potassium channel tetramerisation-type BTB domain-containing protein n=1 Tax=Chaetoceros tenuissimus TaxID=426638 RepID=A0AAD3H9U1_9STRA|nr:hypothetical protein CTEN210_11992 [Chaetoceros tenuissimus]
MSANQNKNTVELNVGGTLYTVSLELINRFPDSKLAKDVSERKEGDDSVFFEANGKMFEYVKYYMRDNSIELPPGASKANFIKELEYFEIEVDEASILIASEINLTASYDQHQQKIIIAHQNRTKADRRNYICDLVAADIQKTAKKLKVDYESEGKTLHEFEYIYTQYGWTVVHRLFKEMGILDDEVKKDFINYINALEILKDLEFMVVEVVQGDSDSSKFVIQVESVKKSKKRPGEGDDDNPKKKVRESEKTKQTYLQEIRTEQESSFVTLEVGGTLNETSLSTVVSDRFTFIDKNGLRFKLVLDHMRDSKVNLLLGENVGNFHLWIHIHPDLITFDEDLEIVSLKKNCYNQDFLLR